MTDKNALKRLFPPRESSRDGIVKFVPYATWIEVGDNQPVSKDKIYCCSNCGKNRRMRSNFKPFCEECGADMREADHDQR